MESLLGIGTVQPDSKAIGVLVSNYVEDGAGVTTRPGGAALRLVRSLIYPDGFASSNDGGLKVVSRQQERHDILRNR